MNSFEGTSFSDPPFFLAFSERRYPNSRRREFLATYGLRIEDLVLLRQIHGSEVVIVGASSKTSGADGDALLTSLAGPALGILTADCIPVFFWDRSKKTAGIAHAGWRGLKAGILARTLEAFAHHFNSDLSGIRVLLGPAIRECCYEVGEEFQAFFPSQYKIQDQDSDKKTSIVTAEKRKGRVNLIGVALERLSKEGILEQNIWDSGICTSCCNQRFFSARREGASERILSIIQIRPD